MVLIFSLVILAASAGLVTVGIIKYKQGVEALQIAHGWLDESEERINVARADLEEMKDICRDIIAPPVYPDWGNDMSGGYK